MEFQIWNEVEDYLTLQIVNQDDSLAGTLRRQNDAGFPQINVPPTQGKLLYLLIKIMNARNVLEIGTLGGYSTLWMAKAIQDGGRVISLEIDPEHANISRENLKKAGMLHKVEIIVGNAKETLPKISGMSIGPFDLIFIDADKESIPFYFDWSLKYSRPGTVMVVDNVIRNGKILSDGSSDPSVKGVRELIERVKKEQRVEGTAIQTVSGKGYDGFMVLRVR